MIKAVLFDMDGLMFDTETLAIPAWEWIAKELDYPMTKDHIYHIFGKGLDQIEIYLSGICGEKFDFETSWNMRLEYVTKWIDEHGVPVKPGLYQLLSYLDGSYKMAVASSTNEDKVKHYLKLAQVEDYFDVVISGDMVEKGKPAPDIFLLAANKLKVAPEECLVLEDAPSGIQAAYMAGMQSIMIPDKLEINDDARHMFLCERQNLEQVIDVLKEMK